MRPSSTRKVAQPGIDTDLSHLDYDHCFEGWRGRARGGNKHFGLQLGLGDAVPRPVYTPPERDYFCVEPVSHLSNAIPTWPSRRRGRGLTALAPGETLEAAMRLDGTIILREIQSMAQGESRGKRCARRSPSP